MKVSIYPNSKLSGLPENIGSIHLVRAMKEKKLKRLLKRVSGIKKITMSPSCFKRLSSKAKEFLKKQDIEIKVKSERGRAISIPLEKMLKVIEMRKDFRPLREIEEITGIPKSTIHYLEKYSNRRKVKNGKNVIYLK